MLSRVASNLYWTTRYLERAENTARLINVHGNLLLDLPRNTASVGWDALLSIIGSADAFFEHYRVANETNVIKFLVSDEDNPSAILSALRAARENLRTTRDVVPREAWEEVNDLYLAVQDQLLVKGLNRRVRYDFLKYVIRSAQLITGLLHGTMSHGTTYNFMRIGCYLERADMTSRILDVRSANLLRQADEVDLTPFENIQWMSVLKSLTAYQMYRQHVRLRVQGGDVLNFLMRDEEFPRAILYCLQRIGFCLQGLPKNSAATQVLQHSIQQVSAADVHALAQNKSGLHQFMDELQVQLAELHNSINNTYFNLAEQSQSQSQAA
ncbi:MAG: alpha-E domain-containing protein [Candidatus Competibacteraceae bacterium]|nr:alpha-E domain-containing protein [Candidatus Competibacteraceae bacterium]MCB1806781.1 alpha-E domain-containing protein [Candidatus Competibacteraceae bacterium]